MAKPEPKSMVISDFNLPKLSTRDLSRHVAGTIDIGSNIAVFGRRGTGKTEIAKQEISKAKLKEVYMNLSVFERVDMGGYPDILSVQMKKRFVEFLLPKMYEAMIDGPDGVVAILDEVDKADPSLWGPLLEFTQFKSINGNKFPFLKAIIMTGNLISEGGARPSLPLLDRCEKYLVEADVASWLAWAGESGKIHPAVSSFINDNQDMLIGEDDPDEKYADQSPRGWANASSILFKGEERKWDTDMLNTKVCGCVGKEAGEKYKNYYAYYKELLPLVDQIFDGKNVTVEYESLNPTKRLISCMITCSRLSTQLDQSKDSVLPDAVKYVGKLFSNIDYEHVLVGVRSQITVARLIKYNLDDHADWSGILSRISDSVTK